MVIIQAGVIGEWWQQEPLVVFADEEKLFCSAMCLIKHMRPATVVLALLIELQKGVVTEQLDDSDLPPAGCGVRL
jgi:hypothetical protein